MSRREKSIAWLDIETSGLDVNKHEIIEIAIVITDFDLNELKSYEAKTLMIHPNNADKKALAINGYDEQLWKSVGIHVLEAVKKISSMIPYGEFAIPAGHNISNFDLPFIRKAFKFNNIFCPLSYYTLDTYSLAVTYMVKNKIDESLLPNLKLTTLTKVFGIEHNMAHSAMADVRANIEVYKQLCLT
jgi:exonuclease I